MEREWRRGIREEEGGEERKRMKDEGGWEGQEGSTVRKNGGVRKCGGGRGRQGGKKNVKGV